MTFIELVAISLLGALWLLVVIKSVAALARAKSVVISSPQGLSVRQIERDDEAMADTMTYEITVAAPAANDVVSREMTVVVDGVYRDPVVFPAYEVNLGQVSAPQDSNVVVSLVDVDDSGNRSEPATVSFQALDVVPPAVPGGLSVTVVGETFVTPDAPEVVEPEVTPEVTPDSEENS
jgi:hypothetical protein